MSQRFVAGRRACASDAGLFWIESGTSMPRIDTLLYLASALGTTVGAIIGEV